MSRTKIPKNSFLHPHIRRKQQINYVHMESVFTRPAVKMPGFFHKTKRGGTRKSSRKLFWLLHIWDQKKKKLSTRNDVKVEGGEEKAGNRANSLVTCQQVVMLLSSLVCPQNVMSHRHVRHGNTLSINIYKKRHKPLQNRWFSCRCHCTELFCRLLWFRLLGQRCPRLLIESKFLFCKTVLRRDWDGKWI